MNQKRVILVGLISLWAGLSSWSAESGEMLDRREETLRKEQIHFLQCLNYVYDPALWFSYEGNLYFQPQTEAQSRHLAELKEARSQYTALTNRWDRYQLAARAMARSGIGEQWSRKVLLPYSTTQPDLTPTRESVVRLVPRFERLQTLPAGDALLKVDGSNCFVVDFGRSMTDRYGTNALLVRLGTKSFKDSTGNFHTVDAFADVGLNREETDIFQRIAKACAAEAAAIVPPPPSQSPPVAVHPVHDADSVGSTLQEEFEIHKRRARDDSPYMQFLLAKDYLEGLGTPKDEKLGWEWMRRAAANGGGDAKAYLRAKQTEPR